MRTRTILIFIDGLGWGGTDPAVNPCLDYGGCLLRLPSDGAVPTGGTARPIDAVLGVPGVPQSATGQTTLLSGVNAQGVLGKHLTGFPNEALREILREHSVLKILTDRGYRACFLNAFRPLFWEITPEQQWRLSATTVANLAAGLPFFTLDDVTAGRSVYQEITNGELRERGFDVPPRTPAEAGRILAAQARGYDFMLFEYFQTDKAGHSADLERCRGELRRLDEFLQAVLETLAADLQEQTLVVLTSDHGNLEDCSTRRHTTNPIPLLAWGRDAREFVAGISRLDQVTPAILARHPA